MFTSPKLLVHMNDSISNSNNAVSIGEVLTIVFGIFAVVIGVPTTAAAIALYLKMPIPKTPQGKFYTSFYRYFNILQVATVA